MTKVTHTVHIVITVAKKPTAPPEPTPFPQLQFDIGPTPHTPGAADAAPLRTPKQRARRQRPC